MNLHKRVFVVLSLACGLPAQAATLNVNNLSSLFGGGADPSLLLLDAAGQPLSSGFVALYSFAGPAPGSASILQANGAGGLLDLVALSPATSPGPGAFAGAFSSPNDGSLNGRNLFIVVGAGGSSVATASSLSLIDTGLSFTIADSPGSPQILTYLLDSQSTIALGTLVDQATADWSFANRPNFTSVGVMGVIPESSSSFLLCMAGVSLLVRRRRSAQSICWVAACPTPAARLRP